MNRIQSNIKLSSYLFLFSILSSCGLVTKNYQKPKLGSEQNALFREYSAPDSSNIADISWKQFFTDPDLIQLIQEGLDKNYDLKNAILQISVAENTVKQSKLAFFPLFNFAPTVTFNHQSRNAINLPPSVKINLQTTNVSIGFQASWELEIWGKLTSAKRGAIASWLQAESSKRVIQTSLVSTIADTYYTLLALDKQLEITQQTIDIREKNIQAIIKLKESGRLTSADQAQAESNLYAAKVLVPDLKRSIRELENLLCILTAKPPQAIKRGKLDGQTPESKLMAGVPAQLLANRPDVQVAELGFRKSWELTNVTRASMYPTIMLTSGSTGITALTTRTLLDPVSIFANLVGGLTMPIFQRWQLKSNYKNAKIAQEQSWNQFQQSLLKAGQEVSNALFAYQMVKEKQSERTLQIESLQKSVDDRMKLLKFSNTTNYTDVLSSEQNLLSAQLSSTTDKLQEFQATIALYRSLGGGWK